MARVFPVGTRFLDSDGFVMVITHYSSTDVRAYCDPVCDTQILPPGVKSPRRGIRVMGGRRDRFGNTTPIYFEPRPDHADHIIIFDTNTHPTDLDAALQHANKQAAPYLTEADELRLKADTLEQQARDVTYRSLGIVTTE